MPWHDFAKGPHKQCQCGCCMIRQQLKEIRWGMKKHLRWDQDKNKAPEMRQIQRQRRHIKTDKRTNVLSSKIGRGIKTNIWHETRDNMNNRYSTKKSHASPCFLNTLTQSTRANVTLPKPDLWKKDSTTTRFQNRSATTSLAHTLKKPVASQNLHP